MIREIELIKFNEQLLNFINNTNEDELTPRQLGQYSTFLCIHYTIKCILDDDYVSLDHIIEVKNRLKDAIAFKKAVSSNSSP